MLTLKQLYLNLLELDAVVVVVSNLFNTSKIYTGRAPKERL